MKKILITGSTGFIGKNLLEEITKSSEYIPYLYTRETSDESLEEMLLDSDYIIHLAGVSRPKEPGEFYEGNSDLTKKITDILLKKKLHIPIFFTSSIHAIMDNDFGKSKRLAEEHILNYKKLCGAPVYIMRLTNTFGKYAKPNAHSVIATFCYNLNHNLEIQVSDPKKEITLVYIDDLVSSICNILFGIPDVHSEQTEDSFFVMKKTYTKTLGEIVDILMSFSKGVPSIEDDDFTRKLYLTYTSYEKYPN